MGGVILMKSAEEQSIDYLKKRQDEVIDNLAEWQMYRFAIEALEEKIQSVENRGIFTKPESPFLLIFEDMEHNLSYNWLETEEELLEVAKEIRDSSGKIVDSIEIGSSREVEFNEEVQDEGWFVESVMSAYETATEQGFDSITLAIDTDMDKTHYINDTENGFQCDSFDCYFDDLDSIASELYNEVHGNVTEIRIE